MATPPIDVLYFGLKLSELLTLIGIVSGPIVAVLVTLWIEGTRRKKEQQVQTLRMLLSTRHLAADPAYSTAINLIPIDFNDCRKVMDAWRDYIRHVRITPTPEGAETHHQDTMAKQTTLIFEMMCEIGFKLKETDIQTSAYASNALIDRDNITLNAWKSWSRIADALEKNNAMLANSLGVSSEDSE